MGGGPVESWHGRGARHGLTYFAPVLAAKQLEQLKETFPQAARIAFVINPDNPAMLPDVASIAEAWA